MKKITYIPEKAVLSAQPSNPDPGFVKLYKRTNGVWYSLDEFGVETPFGGGGIPGGTPTSASSNGSIQYNDGGAFGGLPDIVIDELQKRVGVEVANPEATMHLRTISTSSIPSTPTHTITLYPESTPLDCTSALASLYYLPLAPTNPNAIENLSFTSYQANFQTLSWDVYPVNLINGIEYRTNQFTTITYTDAVGDNHDFGVDLTWDAMANATAYYVYNYQTGAWGYTATNAITDDGTWSGSDNSFALSSWFTSDGAAFNFSYWGTEYSPSGFRIYSPNTLTSSVVDALNDGITPYIIVHDVSFSTSEYFVKEIVSDLGDYWNQTTVIQGNSLFIPAVNTSLLHYGFVGDGSTRHYKVYTYNSTLGAWSATYNEQSITLPNDSNYYYIQGSYIPNGSSYKIFRTSTHPSYPINQTKFLGASFYNDDFLDNAWAQNDVVTPNAILGNTLIAEKSASTIHEAAHAVLRTNQASRVSYERLNSGVYQEYASHGLTTAQEFFIKNTVGQVRLLNSSSQTVARLGSLNIFNEQQSSSTHFKVYSLSSVDMLHVQSDQNAVYVGTARTGNPQSSLIVDARSSVNAAIKLIRGTGSQSLPVLAAYENASLSTSFFSINSMGGAMFGKNGLAGNVVGHFALPDPNSYVNLVLEPSNLVNGIGFNGEFYHDFNQSALQFNSNGQRGYLQKTIVSNKSDVTVVNTSAETSLRHLIDYVGQPTTAGNHLRIGKPLKIIASGRYSSDAGAVNLTFRLKHGGNFISSIVIPVPPSQVDSYWSAELTGTVRAVGSLGSIAATARISFWNATTNTFVERVNTNFLSTINTSGSNEFHTTVQWSSSSASRSITATNYYVEFNT